MSQQTNEIYEFGPFRLNAQERLLQREGATLALTPKALDLLFALVKRHGRLVEKEELFRAVWPDSFVEESNLSSHIATIRKTLGDGENGLKLIETVPKRGYRFVVEVREVQAGFEKLPTHFSEAAHLSEAALLPEAAPMLWPTSPAGSTASKVETRRLKRGGWRERLAWVVAGMAVLIALALAVAYVRRPVLEVEPLRFSINPPENAKLFDWPAISPDGRTLAFVAEVGGKRQLWVRPLSGTTARPLVEVRDNLPFPFWSPDSLFIAYFDLRKLKKIALTGGTPETLCDTPVQGSAAWNRDGVILFGSAASGINRVSANGGAVTAVTNIGATDGDTNHFGPAFLPDGRHFIHYRGNPDPAKSGIYLASLEGGESKRLLAVDAWNASLALNPADQNEGYLIFVRQGELLAQSFNFSRNQLAGNPVRIAEHVPTARLGIYAHFSLAMNGALILLERAADQQLTWFDRAGKKLGTVGPPGQYFAPRLSPDGQRLAVGRTSSPAQLGDIHLFELVGGASTPFTFDPGLDGRPIWSPDCRRIVWESSREGTRNLFQKAASGGGQDEVLLRSAYAKRALDWSTDGRFILYHELNPQTSYDLWVLPMEGEGKPWPWLDTPALENYASFSPDGKWIAYQSNESGRSEIYVQAFVPGAPAAGGKRQLSTKGGTYPQWRRAGRELYYVASDGKLMAVELTTGAEIKVGAPQELFTPSGFQASTARSYTVTGDGQRFLFVTNAEDASVPPFTVVLNWMAEVKR